MSSVSTAHISSAAAIVRVTLHGILLVLFLSEALSQTTYAQVDQLIDLEVQRQHTETGQEFAPQCSDEVFIRRVYLDLAGTVPTPEQFRAFRDDNSLDKRNALVDGLLASPLFGIRLADIWDNELCHPKLEWTMIPFTNWLQKQFNINRPWDELTYELLTATGPQYENPAVTVFFGMDKSDTLSPEDATDLVGRAFMGIKLECAQCHDHPNAAWTHERYWKIASLLGRTQLVSGWPKTEATPKPGVNQKVVGTERGIKNSTDAVWRSKLPERSLKYPPSYPDGRPGLVPPEQAREVFADWLLKSEDPYLSRAFVNRVWHQMFGCGFVSPIDDHRKGNPPLYPELQSSLTNEFRESGYDIKQLYRGICRSRTWQQESQTHDDPRSLSGTNIRSVSPNQMFEVLHSVLGYKSVSKVEGDLGIREARRHFLRRFGDDAAKGRPERFSKSLPDFLQMLHSVRFETGIRRQIESRETLWDDPATMIDELYVLTLSRLPAANEKIRMAKFVRESITVEEGYRGVLWVLMNSGDFFLVQ